nr:hypothetical protein CFP56_64847 [Quercus suber]
MSSTLGILSDHCHQKANLHVLRETFWFLSGRCICFAGGEIAELGGARRIASLFRPCRILRAFSIGSLPSEFRHCTYLSAHTIYTSSIRQADGWRSVDTLQLTTRGKRNIEKSWVCICEVGIRPATPIRHAVRHCIPFRPPHPLHGHRHLAAHARRVDVAGRNGAWPRIVAEFLRARDTVPAGAALRGAGFVRRGPLEVTGRNGDDAAGARGGCGGVDGRVGDREGGAGRAFHGRATGIAGGSHGGGESGRGRGAGTDEPRVCPARDGMESLADSIPETATGRNSTPLQRALIRELLLNQEPQAYAAHCRAIMNMAEPDGGFESVKVPVLILAGAEDKSAPLEGCQYILEHLGSSRKRLEVLDGVGHWHGVEAGEKVAEEIRGFVSPL